jgi:micrococcal nuclease
MSARRLASLSVLLLVLFLCGSVLAQSSAQTGKVSWVYDGDTIKVEGIGKVRLIGIDTPEKTDSPRDTYYKKHDQIEPATLRQIARQAFEFNLKLLKNHRVRLEFDAEKTDTYDRTLAYVYLPDGRMLNQLLLEQGLAAVYRRFDFKYKDEFLRTEKSARKHQLGLWLK